MQAENAVAHFQRRYPAACREWTAAEAALRAGAGTQEPARVAGLCRQAMRAFARALAESGGTPAAAGDDAPDDVLRGLVGHWSGASDIATGDFLASLVEHWSQLSDPGRWTPVPGETQHSLPDREAAQTLVYQTLTVMYLMDRLRP